MAAPKTPTPAELASLEHAFAADPSSEAWRPLTDAYLSMGRFMEAMVVAKKGVKAHPSDATARLALARVYAQQGKDRKALEEVQGALAAHPAHPAANLMAGGLHMRLGEKGPGTEALRRAAQAAPSDPQVKAALEQWGVALPPPPPPPPPAPPPLAAAPAGPAPGTPPVLSRAPAAPAREAVAEAPAPPPGSPPAVRPSKSQGRLDRNLEYARELADKYQTQEWQISTGETGELPVAKPPKQSHSLRSTLLLVVGLAIVLGGWWSFTSWRRDRDEKVARLLKEASELIAKDSHGGYKQASALLEQVLQKDPASLAGHAYLAYIDALRWGEHGEGDTFREEAKKHLVAARREATSHSHMIAADAYLKAYGGDPQGAIADLTRVLRGPEAGTSGLLFGALGVLQMKSGDLDSARESLTTARKFADRDVRVNQMLAEVYRRAGQARKAKTFYDAAYLLSREHVPTLLGAATVYIDEGQYDTALKFVQAVMDASDVSPRQRALAQALRGTILFAKGRAAEGAKDEQDALTLDPTNPDIQEQIGRRKLAGGDAGGAAAAIEKAIEMDPQRVAFYVDLAQALLSQTGGAKQAVDALGRAQARLPGNPRVAKLLGDAYRADGQVDRARAEYERALSARYPDARMALARLDRAQGRLDEALAEYEKAAKEYGESGTDGASQAYAEMAEVEAQRGGPARASELYKKALAVDPTSCPALWALGRERADRSEKEQRDLGKQMLLDYARVCPKGPHTAEAAQLAASIR
ncbi:MAG TPA: tetratricopeptide repeat protein [Anaeromyxobacteraceae bacterium]|nr:tetratricopeptide repeat protein [Anaeromyxobacteraceae bacterium]